MIGTDAYLFEYGAAGRVYTFDAVGRTWTQLGVQDKASQPLGSGLVGGIIYLIGGSRL